MLRDAKVGDHRLRGVDLVELDERDRMKTSTVTARPMTALMALGSRMAEQRSNASGRASVRKESRVRLGYSPYWFSFGTPAVTSNVGRWPLLRPDATQERQPA
jgi:hypothetical protein